VVLRDADLEAVREQINRLGKDMLQLEESGDKEETGESKRASTLRCVQPLSPRWCFLDCKTLTHLYCTACTEIFADNVIKIIIVGLKPSSLFLIYIYC